MNSWYKYLIMPQWQLELNIYQSRTSNIAKRVLKLQNLQLVNSKRNVFNLLLLHRFVRESRVCI